MPHGTMSLQTAISQYSAFTQFAQSEGVKGSTILARKDGSRQADGSMSIEAKSKFDFVGHIARGKKSQDMNNEVRDLFKGSVIAMFGGKDENDVACLPDSIRAAMKFDDYGKGKPLTARRILAVQTAVDQYVKGLVQQVEKKLAALQMKPAAWFDDEDDLTDLIRTAVKASLDDKDALELFLMDPVKTLFRPVGDDDDGEFESMGQQFDLRTEDEVTQEARELVADANTLRQVTGGDRKLADVIKPFMLLSRSGEAPLDTPLLDSMVTTVRQMERQKPFSDLKLLRPGAPAHDINQAVVSLNRLLDEAMDKTAPHHPQTNGEARQNYRKLLAGMLLAKGLGDGVSFQKLQTALQTEDAARKLKKYCDDASHDAESAKLPDSIPSNVLKNGMSARRVDAWKRQAAQLDELKEVVDMNCGDPFAKSTPIKASEEHVGEDEFDAQSVKDRVEQSMVEAARREKERFLHESVKGTGQGADALRSAFARKLGEVDAHRSDYAVGFLCGEEIKRTLCQAIAQSKNAFADDKGMEAYKGALSGLSVKHSGLSAIRIAKGPVERAVAAAKAGTAKLKPYERNSTYAVMAILSQMSKAAFDCPGLALNTAAARAKAGGKDDPAFTCVGDPKTDTCVISSHSDFDSKMVFSVDARRSIRQIQTRAEDGSVTTVETGPGSSVNVHFEFRISPNDLDKMVESGKSEVSDSVAICPYYEFNMSFTVNDAPASQPAEPQV